MGKKGAFNFFQARGNWGFVKGALELGERGDWGPFPRAKF